MNNLFEGYGELITTNFEYKGNWLEGKKNGMGIYTWKSKARYVGNYVNDVREGYGEYFFPDMRVIKGDWRNGELVKERVDLKR